MSPRPWILLGAVLATSTLVFIGLGGGAAEGVPGAPPARVVSGGVEPATTTDLTSPPTPASPETAGEREVVIDREPSKDEATGRRHASVMGVAKDDIQQLEALGRRINAFEDARGPAYGAFMKLGTEEAAAVVNAEVERFRLELLDHYDPHKVRLLTLRLRAVPVNPTNDD